MLHLNRNHAGGRVVVTQDGGAGSSGKGLLNQFMATQSGTPYDIATCNFMPNAGHTVVLSDGSRIVTQQIPSAFLDKDITLMLNAGSAIEPELLLKEIKMLDDLGYDVSSRLFIHPSAAIITEKDRLTEKELLKSGSTFKGCGAVSAAKVMRLAPLASSCDEISRWVKTDFQDYMLTALYNGCNILIEGAQGIDLDLNHGQYPYCTSRQTHPGQLIADACIPANMVSNIIINWRTHPIRISNESAADGTFRYSGDCFGAPEITWDDVAIEAGYTPEEFMSLYQQSLLTTVTRKVRRVFRFPTQRANYVFNLCGGPGFVINSLNFLNWVDRDADGMTDKVASWLDENWSEGMRKTLAIIRWGEDPSQVAVV